MRLFCRKRGNLIEIILSPFFILLVIFTLVLFPLLNYVASIGESSYFEREFLSRDVALVMDTLIASPNNVEIDYNVNLGLNLTIEPGLVSSHSYDTNPLRSPSKVSKFPFVMSNISIGIKKFSPKVEKINGKTQAPYPYTFTLLKIENTILKKSEFSSTSPVTSSPICKQIQTFIPDWRESIKISVIVKTKSGTDQEKIAANGVCTGLVINPDANIYPTQESCSIGSKTSRSCTDSDLIIYIYITDDRRENKFDVYYYHNDGDDISIMSKKLGCIMLGTLKEINLYASHGIGLDNLPKELVFNDDDDKACIGQKPVVIVDVGDVKFLKDANQITSVSNAIFMAIEAYYGS